MKTEYTDNGCIISNTYMHYDHKVTTKEHKICRKCTEKECHDRKYT